MYNDYVDLICEVGDVNNVDKFLNNQIDFSALCSAVGSTNAKLVAEFKKRIRK